MMNKDTISFIIPTFLILIISLIIAIVTIYDLEEQVKKEYLRGYEDGKINTEYQTFEDWLDFYEEYYELYVDYKVLEERLKNQPSNEKYIKQIVDDFELVIELQQYYYQEKITTHSFGDWIQINYPELYERIRSYF